MGIAKGRKEIVVITFKLGLKGLIFVMIRCQKKNLLTFCKSVSEPYGKFKSIFP